jgi:ketosteroid isomerase-like protein
MSSNSSRSNISRKMVVLGHFIMRLKSTGKEFRSLWAHVWTLRHGGAPRFYEYVDTGVVSKAHTAKTKSVQSHI